MPSAPPQKPSAGTPVAGTPSERTRSAVKGLVATLLCLAGIAGLLYLDGIVGNPAPAALAGERLGYGLLFLAGFFTGFHCVGMCGALVVSYAIPASKHSPAGYQAHLFYGCGKTLSYTTIGALFGGVGAVVTFTPFLRGLAGLAAGLFLVLFGLGLLNVFAGLNRLRIKPPAVLMRFIASGVRRHSHPFVIGLLNGLMIICGPLQAMYILAAGTGSPAEGARMLFVFGLGTLPVMTGFGVLASTLSASVAPRLVRASGYVVIALGCIMLNRGLAMTGSGYDFHTLSARLQLDSAPQPPPATYQEIRMRVTGKGFEPDHFNLVKDVPVRWLIEGEELNYCNHRIVVPALALEFDVQKGENVIEFTPTQIGAMPWSCWMGMIPGTFLVHEQPPPEPAAPNRSAENVQALLNVWLDRLSQWLKNR
ncbi:MAG: sulfite exporter TauE/SafE family protein [Methylococcaceae bacterium]|nr:sulfite exporter TauE/SafE family protein [Methylococcaceae bacterium]